MRTRQNSRKPINLPGRYFTGLGQPEDVLLSDLSVGGCRFATEGREMNLGAPIQIFVQSSGPHRAIIKWVEDDEVGVTFATPLSEDLFESFQATHVPDSANDTPQADFEDMPSTLPQRFC